MMTLGDWREFLDILERAGQKPDDDFYVTAEHDTIWFHPSGHCHLSPVDMADLGFIDVFMDEDVGDGVLVTYT